MDPAGLLPLIERLGSFGLIAVMLLWWGPAYSRLLTKTNEQTAVLIKAVTLLALAHQADNAALRRHRIDQAVDALDQTGAYSTPRETSR